MKHFTIFLVAVLALGLGAAATAHSQAWRMNCGGPDYTFSNGDFFQADSPYVSSGFGYVGGTPRTYTHTIEGTPDIVPYQTIRFSPSPGFSYVFDNIQAGVQRIVLCFMEPVVPRAGDRLMDISVEGVLVLDNFDIFAAAGAQWTAVNETLFVDVQDGQLNIDFDVDTNNPAMVCAIAVTFDHTNAVDETDGIPDRYELMQNYPNPFNPTTTIRYSLKGETRVTLKVYNLLGQEVKTLVDELQTAGAKQVQWDGKNQKGAQLATGMYIYRLKAGNFVESRKMILSK